MYNHGPYPIHAGYQQGYAVHEEQTKDYPAYEPNGGPTRAYNPPFQMLPKVQPNPIWPAPGQSEPVISNSQKRNNRKKRQRAAQGTVIRPVLRAAQPGQQWILVPAQPSGNEVSQTRCLEYNSTAGASEAQHLQPGP